MDFQNLEFLQLALAIVGALLAVSEALSFIPSIKANGIFQVVINVLVKCKDFLVGLVKKPEA